MPYAKRILAALIGLGLIVLIFVLIVKGFSSGNTTPVKPVDLAKFSSTDAVSQLIIDGPVVINQEHRTIRVSVSQTESRIEIVQGYDGDVIESQSFPNTQSSYAVFLQSLAHLDFSSGSTTSSLNDERGYCPNGNRYIYQLKQEDKTVLRFWSTSCGQGTFGGKRAEVRALFRNQIPQATYNKLTSNIPQS